MKNVYLASKTILLFLFIVLITQTVFGEKTSNNMILMILFSMLILNSDKLVTYLKNVTDNLTTMPTDVHKSSSDTIHGGSGGSF